MFDIRVIIVIQKCLVLRRQTPKFLTLITMHYIHVIKFHICLINLYKYKSHNIRALKKP